MGRTEKTFMPVAGRTLQTKELKFLGENKKCAPSALTDCRQKSMQCDCTVSDSTFGGIVRGSVAQENLAVRRDAKNKLIFTVVLQKSGRQHASIVTTKAICRAKNNSRTVRDG
jgi:hypothetical protein